ncbi:hypothetical protein ACFL14_00400 [Patescibacteria group bacterium]
MPNGLPHDKEYGPHAYDSDGSYTGNCKHNCGCSIGPTMSHGPLGLDPFGECPGNPKDGKSLGGDRDYECVVERRILHLQKKASERDKFKKLAGTDKVELQRQVDEMHNRLINILNTFNHFSENMTGYLQPPPKPVEGNSD